MGISPGSTKSRRNSEKLAERAYIEATLRSNDWNVSRTAERLGVERTNLHKKIKQYASSGPEALMDHYEVRLRLPWTCRQAHPASSTGSSTSVSSGTPTPVDFARIDWRRWRSGWA